LTPPRRVIENRACMKASWQITELNGGRKLVTNSVTNPLGKRGQCRATVTNFVTKLSEFPGSVRAAGVARPVKFSQAPAAPDREPEKQTTGP